MTAPNVTQNPFHDLANELRTGQAAKPNPFADLAQDLSAAPSSATAEAPNVGDRLSAARRDIAEGARSALHTLAHPVELAKGAVSFVGSAGRNLARTFATPVEGEVVPLNVKTGLSNRPGVKPGTVITKANTPTAITPQEFRRAALATGGNAAAFALGPVAGGAVAGAANDPEHPLRGAAGGAIIGEGLGLAGKATGKALVAARTAVREHGGPASPDLAEGVDQGFADVAREARAPRVRRRPEPAVNRRAEPVSVAPASPTAPGGPVAIERVAPGPTRRPRADVEAKAAAEQLLADIQALQTLPEIVAPERPPVEPPPSARPVTAEPLIEPEAGAGGRLPPQTPVRLLTPTAIGRRPRAEVEARRLATPPPEAPSATGAPPAAPAPLSERQQVYLDLAEGRPVPLETLARYPDLVDIFRTRQETATFPPETPPPQGPRPKASATPGTPGTLRRGGRASAPAAPAETAPAETTPAARSEPATVQIQPPYDNPFGDLAQELARTKSELARVTQQRDLARRAAETDPLTGVGSRLALNRALPAAERDPGTHVVVFDANNFGQINKRVSQEAGDAAIQDVAHAIQQAAAEHGAAGRVFRRGGDEFVVLAPAEKADAIRTRAEQLYGEKDYGGVTVSISGTRGNSFHEADAILQAAKKARKAAQARAAAGETAPAAPTAPATSAAERADAQKLIDDINHDINRSSSPAGRAEAAARYKTVLDAATRKVAEIDAAAAEQPEPVALPEPAVPPEPVAPPKRSAGSEVRVGKPRTSRRTRANGVDGETEIEVGDRMTVRARVDFATGRAARVRDPVWSVWERQTDGRTGAVTHDLHATKLTRAEAIELAKSIELQRRAAEAPPEPEAAAAAPPPEVPAQAAATPQAPRTPPDVLNVAKLDLSQSGEARVRARLEELRATKAAERQTFAQADVNRTAILRELTGQDPKALNPIAARKLSGEELLARRDIVSRNDALIEQLSQRLSDPRLTAEEAAQATELYHKAIAQNDALLSDLVIGSSQKGRDLNLLRRMANRSLDQATWEIHAKRMLGDAPLTDAIRADLTALVRAAQKACHG